MTPTSTPRKPHIVFYFSDTGGGHRSAAEAIIEAIGIEYPNRVTTEMVDFFKDYAPLPFNKMPDWYPHMVKAPYLWEVGYRITDGRLRARAITASMWPYVGRAAINLVKSHPADMVVSVHPLATTVILKAFGRVRPPFITVVTDWISNHALWYDKRSDLIIVPTEAARSGAIRYGMEPDKVIVAGFPVASRHCVPPTSKTNLRKKLNWLSDKMTVLVLGGREGMGPLLRTVTAINNSGLDISLIIITGNNIKLRKKLISMSWNIPTTVYGFVHEIPDFMRASDVLITKAGAATIAEALNAGLPMIFHSYIPGQEDGNLEFVINSGAGIWAPTPRMVISALAHWFHNHDELIKRKNICLNIAQPDSARVIAHLLGDMISVSLKKR